jgi:hypothetical protein
MRRGKSRHTTQSSMREWLRFFPPPAESITFVISNNPHVPRAEQEVSHALRAFKRIDVSVLCCGSAAAAETPIELIIGEIGRLLYNDLIVARSRMSF